MKIYATIEKAGSSIFAAHITKRTLDDLRVMRYKITKISKNEYRSLRANGVPSWGMNECRMSGMNVFPT